MKKMDINKKKIAQATNYIEELSWIIDKNKNVSLKEIVEVLRDYYDIMSLNEKLYNNLNISNIRNHTTNKNFLVGVLPSLFLDDELFKSNDDLLDFAEEVLNLQISRKAKRSRIEYIGWIVCETTKLNDNELFSLVSALESFVNDDKTIKKIKEAKKSPNFSWNETIKKLGKL